MPARSSFHRISFWENPMRLALLAVVGIVGWLQPSGLWAAPTITYVQGNYATPQTAQTTVKVTFTSAQAAGDLNVVVVGWNDGTVTVSSVADSRGNVYARAVGPTVQSGTASQSIYYAKNIASAAAGANAVTVTFSAAAAYPDIRILEYSGADPGNPVDVVASNSGSSTSSSSGSATTTNATDLIFGANLVQTATTGAGSGFTKRLLTSPDSDIAEDRMVTATGSYSATAPVKPAGPWIMQMVAFRTPGTSGGSFTISASPASLTVAQGNQGATTVTTTIGGGFNSAIGLSASGAPAGTTVSFNPSAIAAPGSGSSTMTVTVGSGTAVGTYPITVSGTGGGLQQTATVTLTVTAASSFTLSASPATVSVVQGNQGTSTITSTVSGSFNSAISLSASGAPSGTTVSFNPSTIGAPGAGSSTMTITVGSSTALGTYTITITGNGGGVQQNATVTLTVGSLPTAPTNLAGSAGGPGPTVVAAQGLYDTTLTTSHTTAAFNSTGGDLIVMLASSHAGVTFTPSDSFGNIWIPIAGPTSTTQGFDLRTEVWYAPNPVVGPGHTVTVALSAAQSLVISIIVVKGSNVSSPIDAVSLIGSDNGTQTLNVVSPSLTTAAANDLLIGFVKLSITDTYQSGPGFTEQAAASLLNLEAETGPAATPGIYNATFTVSQPATWQSAIAAAANNPNQASLSWTASTESGGTISNYLVERCQGAGCVNFAQVGTTATTSFSDTGLTASTSYSYRVRAQDTTGTLGPYSSVVSVATPAPTPSLPGNLTATAASGTQINLAWTASTEAGGAISNYLIERCQGVGCTNFGQIGTSATITFSDTSVSNSSYSYRVRAMDAVGNVGPYSNVASATIDTQPPTAPTNLAATPVSGSEIDLSWTASTDNVGVTGYLIERCQGSGCTTFAQTATSTGTTYNDTGLAVGTSYSYRVRATDAAGNLSSYSNVASATTSSTTSAIAYVQGNYSTPQSPQTTVNVTFAAAQAAGDLNVVVVGWTDTTASVTSVTDKSGNTYTLAVGPTLVSGALSQSIYYAKNIAAAGSGANTVTVTFSAAATYPDIRILEYSGADPGSPVDVTAAGSGSSTTSSSGSATTTNPTDLIFGANLVQTGTSGPGAGFASRLLTSPDGDIAEDRLVAAAASYSATAPLSSAGSWIMQMVAFRTPVVTGGSFTLSASPTSLSIATGNQGTSTLTTTVSGGFNSSIALSASGAPAGTTVSFSPSTIVAPGAGSSTMTITVGASTAAGTYPITVTGSGGGAQQNITVTLTVTASPSFALSATPATVSVVQGSQGASTITTTVSGGFNSALALSASGAPSGTTVSFNPSTIAAPGAGTSTMTIAVGSSTPIGSYTITVTGNGGGIQQTAIVTLTVTAVSTTISYVQGNYATPQSSQTTVSVPFTGRQIGGDLIVAVVGWNDTTATVSSVTDSSGNSYARAVGPTIVSGALSQSIYYAKNIANAAAGGNVVTVAFSAAAAYPDIRILEYAGADPNNPVDVTAAGTGTSTTSSTNLAATTNATDLIFGANLVTSSTSGPGAGFTQRLLTSPDGDIAEDEMATAIGSYAASAPLSSGTWIMQMVAFRTASAGGGGSTPSVSLSSTSLSFGNQATGTSSNAQLVTLTNNGTAQLIINSITVMGGNTGDFAQTNNCPSTLAANGTCTISVTFTPTTTGSRNSVVSISDNALNSPQAINLTGTGTGFSVTPRASVVTSLQTQQFTANGALGTVSWSVDGVVGGSSSTGTITTGGLYAPPSAVGVHTVTGATLTQSASATVYVSNYAGTFTYHNDNLRTGQDLNETVLNTTNVNETQFGKLFSYSLDGLAFASPLYVANVSIPSNGYHNVVYVATENDTVYAFDADGRSGTPLWKVSFLKSGVTTVPCSDTGECGDIPNQIGITSTPVIDQASGTLYVVAATKEGATYVQRLHALDIVTGAEKFGGPVVLQASVPGTGEGGSTVTFNSLRENQRPGLLLSNGVVYLAFGSHGDNSPWHGWVLGYNATTLQRVLAYNVTPNGNGGGIWQGGGGLSTDASGDIYFVTSNGDFDANSGGPDYGDTVEKLTPGGSVADYFTPHDQATMSNNNLDLGAAGPVLLVDQPTGPYPHLLVTSGKTGTIYVVNRDNMGGYNPNNDNQIVQSLVGALTNGGQEGGNYSTPVYFNGWVYFASTNDYVKAFQFNNGQLSTAPTSESVETYPCRGGSFAISANGTNNGILWAIQNLGDPNNDGTTPGVLIAYDATNVSHELYNSSQAGSRDTMDYPTKFAIPLVANGKVFVAGQTQLVAYGLLP